MSTREKIKRGNDLRVTTRRTNRDKINAKMHTLLAAAGAPRQDKRENTRFAWRGGRTATRSTLQCTLCLPRRAHRDKINAKIHAVLGPAHAPREDKHEHAPPDRHSPGRGAHRDKTDAKIHALLAAEDAPRQDKRENTRFTWRGERTATR